MDGPTPSAPGSTPPPSRPSAARREGRALEWFALLCTLALAAGGMWLLARARQARVVQVSELGGLRLRLESADWLRDGMLHPGTTPFGMPAAMMPGMPEARTHRLQAEFTVYNPGPAPRDFRVTELVLQGEAGRWETDPGEAGRVRLGPGQLFSALVQFDVPEEAQGALHLWWEREGGAARLLVTQVPEHEEREGEPPPEWPTLVEALPPGRAAAGAALYAGRLACASCHGEMGLPASATVGPGLGALAQGPPRVPGKSVAQYAYESLLAPDAFLAPVCPGGQACTAPSAMPPYGELMSLQDMADLVAFLLSPRVAQGE